MSQIHEKSPKHCAMKQELNFNKFKKPFFYLSILFLIIILLLILLWLTLNPKNPKFFLNQVNINKFNFTTRSFLNSTIDLTLLSKNPNKRVGVYYDDLIVYASYKGQKITPKTTITAFYQDHEETNILSMLLLGTEPMVPFSAYEVQRGMGKLDLNFQGMGWLRWKVGFWVSSRRRFRVNCIIVMPLIGNGSALSYSSSSKHGIMCSTSV